MHCLKCTKET